MDSPFYQPARQSFSSSQNMQQPQGGFGGFGGGQGFGGFQQQSWGGGFGGNQGFGGFGGGGFQPQGFGFGGGYGGGFRNFGGFQPQQQFNPYQGGFGGFGGFGGGYNPMFGGIGGLGFNPMMGPQFGMPMGGFNPYQPQQRSYDGMGDGPFDPYAAQQAAQLRAQMSAGDTIRQRQAQSGLTPLQPQQQPVDTSVDAFKNSQAYQDAMQSLGSGQETQDLGYSKYGFSGNARRTGTLDRAYEDWKKSQPIQPAADQQSSIGMDEQARRLAAKGPMYGGIGGLGFNPMMGPQFGMPMTRDVAFSQGMLTPQQRQQMFAEQEQRRQTENSQREELKNKFGAGIFEGEGRGGGLRFREDYNESPELSAFTKTPEYQRAKNNFSYLADGPNAVDTAFKDWLYKNKDTLSSGALGFMTEATKAKNAAQDAEITRRAALTPEQRMREDQKMHADMAQEIHKFMKNRGMPMQFDPDQVSSAPTYTYGPQEAQAAANASRLQYGY